MRNGRNVRGAKCYPLDKNIDNNKYRQIIDKISTNPFDKNRQPAEPIFEKKNLVEEERL